MKNIYIVWTEISEMAVVIFEEHHKGGSGVINSLFWMMQEGNEDAVRLASYKIMTRYTRQRFKPEEYPFGKSGRPDTDEKGDLLHQFERNLMMLAQAFRATQNAKPLLAYLKEWCINHINREDQVVAFLRKHLAKGVAGTA